MTNLESRAVTSTSAPTRMRLGYGLNEIDNWRQFALGPHREAIWARFRDLATRVIRIFVFERPTPDPLSEWDLFAHYVQAVINAGAVPMITFAKLPTPYDDARSVADFSSRCGEVARRCLERWGESVRSWYWSIGNEPNSAWTAGNLTFEQYRRFYEESAQAIVDRLAPCLRGRKPMIGGPAADGFQPFWFDWMWRLVHEVDHTLLGFIAWHWYGDWRERGTWGSPADETLFKSLLMSRSAEYESRARAIGRLLRGRGIENICCELNAHSHHEKAIGGQFNQTVFGAAYYASALIHLIRGGADLELFCAGSDDAGPYGLMDSAAHPTPVFHAKKLFTSHVRPGNWIEFPSSVSGQDMQVLLARDDAGRQNAVFVHLADNVVNHSVSALIGSSANDHTLLQLDRGTAGNVVERRCDDTVRFDGYGLAVVTSSPALAERA